MTISPWQHGGDCQLCLDVAQVERVLVPQRQLEVQYDCQDRSPTRVNCKETEREERERESGKKKSGIIAGRERERETG